MMFYGRFCLRAVLKTRVRGPLWFQNGVHAPLADYPESVNSRQNRSELSENRE